MTPETFCEQFATFAEAPNGVAKLRELILQLAVQGKLGTQDVNDEPARLLLKRVIAAKPKDNGATRSKSAKVVADLTSDSVPFAVPSTWTWCRLEDIAPNVQYGYTASADASRQGIRLLRITDIQNNMVDWPSVPGCEIDEETYQSYALQDDDIVIARTGGTIGKSFLVEGISVRAVFASYLIRVTPSNQLHAPYIKRFLESPTYWTQLQTMSAGTGQPNVNGTALKSLLVPLPPLAEQRRIVGKVDQLLGLCDELAARQAARREARSALVGATLDRLVSARSAAEFPAHAHRLRDHFDRLFDTPTTLPQLRQAILQLAVQGQLVPQDPNDEPASVAEGATEVRGLFDIPRQWQWVTAEQMADSRLGKMLDKEKNKGTPFAYLRNTNVHWFRFDLSSIKEMPFAADELDAFEVRPGDVLICEGGHGIGRTAVWNGELKRVMFQKALHRVRPSRDLDGNFFAYCMRVYDATGVLQTHYTGAGIPHLTGRSLAKVAFPLPPLSEQKRIVSKVTELLSLCDALEAKLTQAESASSQLLAAAVHHLLSDSTANGKAASCPM